MSEWQPIETAPRDGTGILACYTRASSTFYMMDTVSWHRGRWAGKQKDVEWTHWMPLPKPPQ